MAFTFCHIQIIYVFWSPVGGCYGRMELDSGSVLAVDMRQKQAAWLINCPLRLWTGCHSRGAVVWEQLSHSAPAVRPWYQTGWLPNCFHVCFYMNICVSVLRYAHGGLFPQSARPSVQCGSVCRPSPLHYSSQCVTCSPHVTFHPCLPHS